MESSNRFFSKFRWNLKSKLIVSFSLILLIPSLIIGWMTFQKSQTQIETLLLQSAEDNVSLINRYINDFMITKTKSVDTFAGMIEGEVASGSGPTGIRNGLRRFVESNPQTGNLFVFMEDGTLISADGAPPAGEPEQSEWYQEASARSGQLVITNAYRDQEDGPFKITVAKSVADGAAVVGLDIALDEIRSMIEDIKFGQNGYVVIYSKNKQFLIHPTIETGTPVREHNQVMYEIDSGWYEYFHNGEPKKMIYITNPVTGWKLAGNMSQQEVRSMTRPILDQAMIVVLIALVVGGVLIYLISLSIVKPLQQMAKVSRKISEGDLTERIEIKSRDEIGSVAASFNEMADSLQGVLAEVGESAKQLAASAQELATSSGETGKASEQIASTIQQFAIGSENQVKSMSESAEAVNEMKQWVGHVSERARTVSASTKQTSEMAGSGSESVQSVIRQMHAIHKAFNELSKEVEALGERSQEIGQIVEIITDISAQTNLLSLNAAIEAARAGEHGRGFAVVAGEVRKLADQSAQSAQQISELIVTIREEAGRAVETMRATAGGMDEGIGLVNTAGESFEMIRKSVEEVSAQIGEVSEAAERMANSTNHIVESVQLVHEVAKETSEGTQNLSAASQEQLAAIEEMSASSENLHAMSENLKKLVERFRIA